MKIDAAWKENISIQSYKFSFAPVQSISWACFERITHLHQRAATHLERYPSRFQRNFIFIPIQNSVNNV